jgi:hypothetical protein
MGIGVLRLREPRVVRWAAAIAFLIAFAIRLYWVFRVQSPFAVVYSDMEGYVRRARDLVAHLPSDYPRVDAFYPFGAHYFYAGVFASLGYGSETAIKTVQALMTAIPIYFFGRFSYRLLRSVWVSVAVSLVVAVWQPMFWFVGYFLSEVPFLALLYCNMWLCLRFRETGRDGFWMGLTAGLLFIVRPQVVLTFALLGVALLFRFGLRRYFRGLLWTAAGFLPILLFSVLRFYALTGHVGLISENANLNRVFADTPIARVDAHWTSASGHDWAYWFSPPTKRAMGETEAARVEGYIGDPRIMASLRQERLRGYSVWWRVHRALNNVRLLWDRNEPWPESDGAYQTTGGRRALEFLCGIIARWTIVPLAPFALFFLRKRTPHVIAYAHLSTLVVLSMFYYPESRYRCPYDPLLIVLTSSLFHRGYQEFLARRASRGVRRSALALVDASVSG